MKQLFVLFLLCPALTAAQRTEWDIAYTKSIPDTLTEIIRMPEKSYNPNPKDNGIVHTTFSGRVLIIQSDSLYKQLFGLYIYTNDSLKAYKAAGCDQWHYNWMKKHHVDSLPIIDFSKEELIRYAACAQCLAFCRNAESRGPCHRNACSFRETWFIREKKTNGASVKKGD
jgi:hypothetical protein